MKSIKRSTRTRDRNSRTGKSVRSEMRKVSQSSSIKFLSVLLQCDTSPQQSPGVMSHKYSVVIGGNEEVSANGTRTRYHSPRVSKDGIGDLPSMSSSKGFVEASEFQERKSVRKLGRRVVSKLMVEPEYFKSTICSGQRVKMRR